MAESKNKSDKSLILLLAVVCLVLMVGGGVLMEYEARNKASDPNQKLKDSVYLEWQRKHYP